MSHLNTLFSKLEKKPKEPIKTRWKIFWLGFFLLIWIGTAIYVVTQTPEWSFKYMGAFVLGNLCMLLAAFYMWWVYRTARALPTFSAEKIKSYYTRSLWIVGLAVLVIPFFFIIHVPDSAHNWDFFEIFVNTSALHGQSFSQLPMTENQLLYFLRYPNNQFFGILYNALFAPFGMTAKIWVETAFSALLTSLSVLAGSLLVQKIASTRTALLYNIVAFGFVPFYIYGAEFYTDTFSLPFVVVGLLFMVYALKAKKTSRQILWWTLASLVVFFGYAIKPTVFIPFLAVGLWLLINKKWKKLLIMLPVCALLFVGVHETVKITIASEPAFSASNNNKYNLPLIHWVTMSFAPENKYGGFNPAVLAYSESFPNVAAKQAGDLKLFLSNLKKQGVGGILLQLWRKIEYTWLNGDLSDFFYTYHHQNPFVYYFFDWTSFAPKEGNITGWLLIKAAQTLYWAALVPLMWFEIGLALWRKRQTEWFILGLSMVGLTGFLLIWEANSRYLYNFAPLIVALATLGLIDFLERQRCKKCEREERG